MSDASGTAATAQFFTMNSNGSVLGTHSTTGARTEGYEYRCFGTTAIHDGSGTAVTSIAGNVGNPYRFHGRRAEFEEQSPLYFHRTRHYEPDLGRFVGHDKPGDWYDGANLGNGLAYCHNDPVNFVDPFGLDDGATAPETASSDPGRSWLATAGGFAQLGFALLEGIAVVGLAVAPEPAVSKGAALFVVTMALDDASAGLMTIWYGQSVDSLRSRAAQGIARSAGGSERTVFWAGVAGDFTGGVASGRIIAGGEKLISAGAKTLCAAEGSVTLLDDVGKLGIETGERFVRAADSVVPTVEGAASSIVNVSEGLIDPVFDNDNLARAFAYCVGSDLADDARVAFEVVTHQKGSYVLTRDILQEFLRGPRDVGNLVESAARKDFIDYLLSNHNVRVLSRADTALCEQSVAFQAAHSLLANAAGGGFLKHAADIRHASFASALGIPLIGDRRFAKFYALSVQNGRAYRSFVAQGHTLEINNLAQFAAQLGVR